MDATVSLHSARSRFTRQCQRDRPSFKAATANCGQVGDHQNPEGVITYYWDVDEDRHDRQKKQHDGYHPPPVVPNLWVYAVNRLPDKNGQDHKPEEIVTDDRNVGKSAEIAVIAITSEIIRPKDTIPLLPQE